jgi:hypothetical protein
MQPAGPDWCSQFPTSTSLDDLQQPFQENCRKFIAELEERGAVVKISATYRPPERAYLMHYCCMIAQGKQDPALVPPMAGVDIQWDLGSPEATRAACAAMMKGYGIVFPAALVSRHTQRRAIDMTISGPYGMSDSALWEFGARFGVIKLVTDAPHWSTDGH